jgi:hypothetical protein
VSVNTRRVSGRRKLRFESMAELEEEIERLATADVECLGNWSSGQIFTHLARVMLTAVDGTELRPPLVSRLIAFVFRPLLKWLLFHRGMPAGIPHKGIPVVGEVSEASTLAADASVSIEEGLAELRTAIERYKSAEKLQPHPGFGRISREDWDRFSLRHAELHLSFVVPRPEGASAMQEGVELVLVILVSGTLGIASVAMTAMQVSTVVARRQALRHFQSIDHLARRCSTPKARNEISFCERLHRLRRVALGAKPQAVM